MTEASVLNPELTTDFTPLQDLATRALQRYGDFGSQPGDPTLMLLFLDLANEIIDEVRSHPYRPVDEDGEHIELPYYTALTDKRPIPDTIMQQGLLAKYASQQGSAKAQLYAPSYFRTLNQVLYYLRYNNIVIRLEPVDGGSNERYQLEEDNPLMDGR